MTPRNWTREIGKGDGIIWQTNSGTIFFRTCAQAISIDGRKKSIARGNKEIGKKRMCELLNVPRSTMYYHPKPTENNDAVILNEVRDIYQESSFYGYRRILIDLRKEALKLIIKDCGVCFQERVYKRYIRRRKQQKNCFRV